MRRLPVVPMLALAVVTLTAGCDVFTGPDTTPASVELTAPATSLAAGATLQLRAVVLNSGGDSLRGQPVDFWSDRTAIATVDTAGRVTSVGPAGQVHITASVGPVASTPVTLTVVAGEPRHIALTTDLPANPVVGTSYPIAVTVTDAYGNPVAGAAVAFARTAGAGTVTPASATTDALGIAGAEFVLGTTVGTNSATARMATIDSVVSVSRRSVAAPAARIVAKTDLPASPVVGTAYPIAVTVTDTYDNPVAGVSVSFAKTSGTGSVTPASGTTDTLGAAGASFTIGTALGTNTATATASSLQGSPVTFSRAGVAAAPASITTLGTAPAELVAGAAWPDSLRVLVKDTYDNPVRGATVAFATTGGGSVSPASALTDSSGQAAARFVTGTSPQTDTATATVSGLPRAIFAVATIANERTVRFTVSGAPANIGLGAGIVMNGNGGDTHWVGAGDTIYWWRLPPGTYQFSFGNMECFIQGGCGNLADWGPHRGDTTITLTASATPLTVNWEYVPISRTVRVTVAGAPTGAGLGAGVVVDGSSGNTHWVGPGDTTAFYRLAPGDHRFTFGNMECFIQGGCGQLVDWGARAGDTTITITASAEPLTVTMPYAPINGVIELAVTGLNDVTIGTKAWSGVATVNGQMVRPSNNAPVLVGRVAPGTYTVNWQDGECGVQGGCATRLIGCCIVTNQMKPQNGTTTVVVSASTTAVRTTMDYYEYLPPGWVPTRGTAEPVSAPLATDPRRRN